MKVLITGDSHTGTVARGKKYLTAKGKWPKEIDLNLRPLGGGHIFPTPFFIDKGDYAEICNPNYQKMFNRFPPLALEKSNVIFGLSGPLHTGRVLRQKDWSKFVPSQFSIHETAISQTLLRQVIMDDCQYLLKFIDVILRTQKLFVIESPRVFKHHYILKSIRADVFTYIDNYYRDIIKEELKLRNVPVIEIPTECYDESGFMLECYRHENEKDQHHGNLAFGKLMMEKVLTFLLAEQKLASSIN